MKQFDHIQANFTQFEFELELEPSSYAIIQWYLSTFSMSMQVST